MRYQIDRYVDINAFVGVMKYYYKITGIPYGFIDLNGNILMKADKTFICTSICRKNVDDTKCLIENGCRYKKLIFQNDYYTVYKYMNELIEVLIPIYIKKVHVADFFIGQVLFEEPDINSFEEQLKKYELNEEEYIAHLNKIPVIAREKLDFYMDFYVNLTSLLSNSLCSNFQAKYAKNTESEGIHEAVDEGPSPQKIIINNRANEVKCSYFIEELKKANENFQKEEERSRKLLEVLPYAVCVRTGEKIVYANDTAAKIFSVDSPEKVINMNINDLFIPHPCMELEFAKKLKKISEHYNTPLEEEILINKIDGRTLYVETATADINYNNEAATLVVFKDITYKKQLEKANKELNEDLNYERLRTDFFSNISHEFRTPLNIIYSATKMGNIMLNNNDVNSCKGKFESYLNMIEQNCFRLMKLVNNILDINKFDYDNMQLSLSKFNIIEVIENTVNLIADYARNKNLKLIFDTEEEEVITMCDADKIERVMFNLLSNAIKFTPPGGEISVFLSYDDDIIKISVKDTGKGIPEDKLNTIFDKFMQVDKSFTRDHEGSGLGLYIVKSIIEMHGGTIRAESILGKGSNFIINLPVKKLEDNIENIQVFNPDSEMLNIEFSDIEKEI